MARAKSTQRAEARRRHRAAQAAAAEAAAAAQAEREPNRPEPVEPRRGFRVPDVRADVAALPGLFRTRRLLWLPILLMIGGFFVQIAMERGMITDTTGRIIAGSYVQFVIVPPAIAPIFLGGFIAPRASYLVGLLLGLLNGVLLLALIAMAAGSALGTGNALVATGVQLFLLTALSGLAIGAFAAWYRDFLRQSAQRRRAKLEARVREQRREQRRGARPAR